MINRVDIDAAPRWARRVRCSIADLSTSVGISRRRLEETFRVIAGLTPKRFQRLVARTPALNHVRMDAVRS